MSCKFIPSGQVAVECGGREEGGGGGGVFTPNSHVRSSEVSNWQTFESHFADERIKWQTAQKLLQNIRITEMFLLLLYIHIHICICYDIVFSLLVLFAFCSLEFSGVSQFTFSHTLLPPLLLQLECALNFILVHSTLTNYFDKYSTM